MKRHATAVWQGSGKEGKGNLSSQTGILDNTQYSFSSRFEDGKGTNPEELIAAAHAGCFAMKLSFVLGESDHTPDELKAKCTITLEDGKITQSKIELKAKVPGISPEKFEAAVKDAEKNCPISVLLDTEIVVEFSLES